MPVGDEEAEESFHDFEHCRWESAVDAYHQCWETLTHQSVEALLGGLETFPGSRVLDLATGTGTVAGSAFSRGLAVTGVDFSRVMLGQARRLHPQVEYVEADACDLPFPDRNFDGVAINFGMLHFEDPEAVLREVHRVLRPGARVGFTVWATPQQSLGFRVVYDAIETYGTLDVPLPSGPPFFRFSDSEETARVLTEAGFARPRTKLLELTWDLPSPDGFLRAFCEGTARTGPTLRAQTKDAFNAIRASVVKAAASYSIDGKVKIPMVALLHCALRP